MFRSRLLVVLMGLLPLFPGLAQQGRDGSCQASSADEAVAIAQQMTGGRVLSVKPEGRNKPSYQVKVLDRDGRVRVVTIAGCTNQR